MNHNKLSLENKYNEVMAKINFLKEEASTYKNIYWKDFIDFALKELRVKEEGIFEIYLSKGYRDPIIHGYDSALEISVYYQNNNYRYFEIELGEDSYHMERYEQASIIKEFYKKNSETESMKLINDEERLLFMN